MWNLMETLTNAFCITSLCINDDYFLSFFEILIFMYFSIFYFQWMVIQNQTRDQNCWDVTHEHHLNISAWGRSANTLTMIDS